MTETNAERLERIKNKAIKDGPHSTDYWGFVYEDVKFLIEQAEQKDINHKAFLGTMEECSEYAMLAEKLEMDNKRLREALKFYADETTYDNDVYDEWGNLEGNLAEMDSGHRARQALDN